MMAHRHKDPRDKAFRLKAEEIKRLIPNMGACYATDMILVDGYPVGYMYRDTPHSDIDSGWHFLSGAESQEYVDDPDHWAIYDVNTVANYDPSIIPLLDAPIGSAFERTPESTGFLTIPMPLDPDDDDSR